MQRVAKDTIRPTDNSECVKIPQNDCKKSNLPTETPTPCPEKPQRLGNDAVALGSHMHAHSDGIDTKTAARTAETVSKAPKKQNSQTHLLA